MAGEVLTHMMRRPACRDGNGLPAHPAWGPGVGEGVFLQDEPLLLLF